MHIGAIRSPGKPRHRFASRIRETLVLLAPYLLAFCMGTATAATFTVNSPADVPDANPGNGVCETANGNGVCTLRAAIQESNALAGADSIVLQAGVIYTLTRVGADDTALNGDLDILDSVTITGAGAGSTTIDGNGNVVHERVMQIFPCLGGSTCDGTHPANVVSISGLTIKNGNSPSLGGGVLNYAMLTMVDCAVTNNNVSGTNGYGGGIYNAGTLILSNSSVSNNVSGSSNPDGGGIYNSGPMTITNSTISGNTSGKNGGGIYTIDDVAMIRNSTISGNTAAVTGGGIYKNSSSVVAINSTISGNFSMGDGGGIYVSGPGSTDLFNVTVARNRANSDNIGTASGGGVAVAAFSTLNFVNSIIALNELVVPMMPFSLLADDDCAGPVTAQGYDIMYVVDSDHCTVSGSPIIADPNLGELQYNGGPTQTHALLSGSVAIDGGNIGGCTDDLGAILNIDQRGLPRPVGSRCDIGAFEAQPDVIFSNGFQ